MNIFALLSFGGLNFFSLCASVMNILLEIAAVAYFNVAFIEQLVKFAVWSKVLIN